MISKLSTFALLLGLAVWAPNANAVTAPYPITGTAKFQIGGGLPLPFVGNLNAITGAVVFQPTTGADPRPMQLPAGILTYPQQPINAPVFLFNSDVFQVFTALTFNFPKAPASFQAGGRTGAATVHFCAGDTVTPAGDPGCLGPNAPGNVINGIMIYQKTLNQFGGPARGGAGGFADVALRLASPAPCDYSMGQACQVGFALATPNPTGAQGGAFGVVVATSGQAGSIFQAKIAANGEITDITSPGLGPFVPNAATSYGGPWTTGILHVTVTAAAGSPETFTLSGMDNRVNGVGTISLVSGSISDRTISLPNANRGWLTITIAPKTPSLSTWGIAVLALLMAVAATLKIRKSSATA